MSFNRYATHPLKSRTNKTYISMDSPVHMFVKQIFWELCVLIFDVVVEIKLVFSPHEGVQGKIS